MDESFNVTFDHHPDVTEDNATHAVVHYEDEWVATLTHDGFHWSLVLINEQYGELGGEIDDDYSTITEFIERVERMFESV